MAHSDLLKQLLPSSYDTTGRVLNAALQAEGNALDAAALLADQLLIEDDPRTAMQLVPDWERVLGSCARSQYQIGPGKYSITQGELVDFSRASAATYFDGVNLKTAAANIARFEAGYLLIEDAGTNYASEYLETFYNTNNPAFSPHANVTGAYPDYCPGTIVWRVAHGASNQNQANLYNMQGQTGRIFAQVGVLKNQGVLGATVVYWDGAGRVGCNVTIDTATGLATSLSTPDCYGVDDYGSYWRLRWSTSGAYPLVSGLQFPIIFLANMAGANSSFVYSGLQLETGGWSSYHGNTAVAALHQRAADISHAWMPLSIQQRRSFLAGKLNEVGGQSKPYFIDLAKSLGYTITIDEFVPATVMSDVMTPMYTREWYFVWRVNSTANANYRQATVMDTVMDAFASWGNADFETALREDAPAHTQVLFAYN